MKSWARAARAASSISARLTGRDAPSAMFSAIEQANNTDSCSTMLTWARSDARLRSRIDLP